MKNLGQPLQSESGFVLIMFLVVVGLIAAILLANVQVLMGQRKMVKANNFHISASIIKNNFTAILKDPTAWGHTVQGNSSLTCVKNGTDCSAAIDLDTPIAKIYDPGGDVMYDSTKADSGLTPSGETCTDFVPVNTGNGSPFCPFRLEVTWRPLCNPGSCMNPSIRVTGTFVFNPSGLFPMNASVYSFQVIR